MTVFHGLSEPDQVRAFMASLGTVLWLMDFGMKRDAYGGAK